ncbi:hypothetical protein EAX61_14595 [Dokdonia sinensis]|uniref:Uncharacterized protein n=1 Tax=Dokdonia sinensis TaxID=2479847 RepID=A0A3M0FUE6_9FLAO|nr:hypothetical protein [Dokdonia sinensis]RMB56314.1 hypothetical protein EAX61_14595 [Dokdonia sinensis]
MRSLILIVILLSSITIIGQNFHTEFEYEPTGITIKNSYPKGGQKHKAFNGKEFIYVTFWTCISNDTASTMELEIDFPADSFTLPSSPGTNFNVSIPNDEMKLEKESLPNYGLDITAFLEEKINKKSNLRATIVPFSSHLFYTVVISDRGVNGPLRAGYELKDGKIIYKINDFDLQCGRIISK